MGHFLLAPNFQDPLYQAQKSRKEGTGMWLMKHTSIINWVQRSTETVLWVNGTSD